MSKLAALIAKHGVSEDDALDILQHVKMQGSEKLGLEAWLKEQETNLSDLRFQLVAKGYDVQVVKHEVPTGET
jgi:diaminopimelate decarboxylase